MYLTTQGLVLRVTKYKDHDGLLTVLTKEHGKLTVKARGLFRKNSPLSASCQLLCYSEFTLFEYREMYTVNEAHTVELFHGLRRDLLKLSLGTYFAQVAGVMSQEDIPNPELLSLTLNCLYALEKLNVSQDQIKAVFEMRVACIAGYAPEIHGCFRCGNPLPDRFNISEGRLECSHCREGNSGGIRMPLLPGALDCIRYICTCDMKKLFSFQIGETSAQSLSEITEAYLTTQLEQGFSTLDFYKTFLFQN